MCQALCRGAGESAPDNSMCKGPEVGQFEQLGKGWVAGSGWAERPQNSKGLMTHGLEHEFYPERNKKTQQGLQTGQRQDLTSLRTLWGHRVEGQVEGGKKGPGDKGVHGDHCIQHGGLGNSGQCAERDTLYIPPTPYSNVPCSYNCNKEKNPMHHHY